MNFYFDGWYAVRSDPNYGMGAEEVAEAIRQQEGVVGAVVVQHGEENGGWGILYIADRTDHPNHEAKSWAVDGYGFVPR